MEEVHTLFLQRANQVLMNAQDSGRQSHNPVALHRKFPETWCNLHCIFQYFALDLILRT